MNRVRLSAAALETIVREAPESSDGREIGGILLGFDADGVNEALVLEAGDPGPRATRRPDFFSRDTEHAQRLADEAFARTTARWIGEWHTHPHGVLAPSRKDMRTYRGFLRDPELAFDSFVAVIVGPGDDSWTKLRAAAWLIEPRRILPALLLPHVDRVEIVLEDPHDGMLAEEDCSDE